MDKFSEALKMADDRQAESGRVDADVSWRGSRCNMLLDARPFARDTVKGTIWRPICIDSTAYPIR